MMDRSAPMLYVRVKSAGGEYQVVTERITEFTYHDRERKVDVCKMTVDNFDLSNFDDPVFRKGAELIVQWGYPGRWSPARTVVITSVKGFSKLQVEAEARSVLMNVEPRSRTFENKKISDVAREIAEDNGYSGEDVHIDDTGETLASVTQARATDAQFLRRLAGRVGFEFYVDHLGFHFHRRRLGERPMRTITYYTDRIGEIVDEPTIENDLTARPGRVRARGRDPEKRADVDVVADNETDTDRETLTTMVETFDFETGRSVVHERVIPSGDASTQSAEQQAQAQHRRAQQVAVKMKMAIVGDPLMFAKSVVKIEGMGRRLSVLYYVEEVEHVLNQEYRCNLKLVSDGHGGHDTTSRLAQGLSLVDVAAAPGRNATRDAETRAQLDAGIAAARDNGDEATARTLESARTQLDAGNRDQAARIAGAVARNPNVNAESRQQSGLAVGSMTQAAGGNARGRDTESAGRVNTQEASDQETEEAPALQPQEVLDPETGQTRIVYRQAPGAGAR